MTESEARLAKALAAAVSCAALLAVGSILLDRVGAARERIAEYELRIESLSGAEIDEEGLRSRLKSIDERLAVLQAPAAAGPPAAFGSEAKRLLAARGIALASYQAIAAAGGEQYEFAFRCGAGAFLSFLQAACGGSPGWRVPYLSLRMGAEGGKAEIVARLSR